MDGLDCAIVGPIAMSQPLMHAFRAARFYREGDMSIANVQNLTDPVFVDSRYSSLMQVADVTAYLLHLLDWERAGLPMKGGFKARVGSVARTLDASLVRGAEPIWMNASANSPEIRR